MRLSGILGLTGITVAAVMALGVVSSMGAVAQAATETEFIAFRPERRDVTSELINALEVPEGFASTYLRETLATPESWRSMGRAGCTSRSHGKIALWSCATLTTDFNRPLYDGCRSPPLPLSAGR